MITNFFSPFSFVAVFGSGIRDSGWVKIRIRDKHPGSATLVASVADSDSVGSEHGRMNYKDTEPYMSAFL
jgi:hypothetical protein